VASAIPIEFAKIHSAVASRWKSTGPRSRDPQGGRSWAKTETIEVGSGEVLAGVDLEDWEGVDELGDKVETERVAGPVEGSLCGPAAETAKLWALGSSDLLGFVVLRAVVVELHRSHGGRPTVIALDCNQEARVLTYTRCRDD
jgi:hypothetical protein